MGLTGHIPLNYQYLNKKGKELWGSFLVEISGKYSIGYIREIRNSVFSFLIYTLTHKAVLPDGITHKLILAYYQDDIHRSQLHFFHPFKSLLGQV